MVPSASVLAAAVPVLAAALARAAVTPTAPWSGQVYNVGEKCDIQWNLDTTGEWASFSITLMTGPDLAMIPVQRVVTGLDGTTGEGSYDYTCPDVSPNAAIYFYQFEQAGQPTAWTTRFTIAAADGSTTDPTEETAGKAWGTGKLVSGSSGVSSGAAALAGAGAGASSAAAASASGPARLSSVAASAGVSTSASAADESSASTDASEPVSTSQSTASSAAETSSIAAPTSSSSSSNSAPAASQTPARTNVDSGAGRAGAGIAAVLGGVLALVLA